MSEQDRILREDLDGLCRLTLNRSEKLNALDTQSFEELDAHCAALEGQMDSVGCVLLQGAGRSFCAGADIGKIGSAPIDPRFKPGVIERLGNLPQPVVAGINGSCFTGGLELALAADLIVADETARFADTHGKWGFVGAWGMSQRLPRRVGPGLAKLMMFTAKVIGASEAQQMGLVDVLVPEGSLETRLRELTTMILSNSWHTNFATKRLMRDTEGMSLPAGLAHEQEHNPGFAPDHQERVARFSRR